MAPDATIAFVSSPWVMVLSAISSFIRLEASLFAFDVLFLLATLYSCWYFLFAALFAAMYFGWYSLTRSLFLSL